VIDRDGAYQALADRIESALSSVSLDGTPVSDGWTVTRQYREFDDSKLPQPACVVAATTQKPIHAGPGNLHTWQLDANAYVYFKNRDPDGIVDTLANAVIDAFVASLNVTAQEDDASGGVYTTLGGKVVRASIEGEIRIFQGFPESQTVVIIPITMLVA
jgi:hypothetical protein